MAKSENTTSCNASCACGPLTRREFVELVGLGTAGLLAASMPVMAGPFTAAEFAQLVPADKKLDPAWVKSLYARGGPTVYRGKELEKIGMPIGGICAGQLYLGGDGRLWLWDIFNQRRGTGDKGYANPPKPDYPVDQGFALKLVADGKTEVRTLDSRGFPEVSFCGQYPIATVDYRDPKLPLSVRLEAFSPFLPLAAEDSCLPATVMSFTVTNTGSTAVDVELSGWLQNAVRLFTKGPGERVNRVVRQADALLLECGVKAPDATPPAVGGHHDAGTMCLGLLAPQASDLGAASLPPAGESGAGPLPAGALPEVPSASLPTDKKLVGALARPMKIAPGGQATATFVIAWHFPNFSLNRRLRDLGRYYATRFADAAAVAAFVAKDFKRLSDTTRLWHDTWYDSTLPHWFLDRTFLNISTLATSTAYWFKNGRFYGWEGVGCCPGTCTHVWHYAQAMGRVFPELERILREKVDFGSGLRPDGTINHRGDKDGLAVDGQAGCILRAYREHQMSPDAAFLKRLWPKIKLAMECLVRMDKGQGLLEGAQHNTLDQAWFGKVAWLSSMYVAAARACEEMAKELGDAEYAAKMRAIVERGARSIDAELFNGEYYYQIADKDHVKTVGSHNGCEIDQVLGESWCRQVHLGRILSEANVKRALQSLWKYNFTPDVGPYRQRNKPGRWYAMAGEGGLLMCSWPKGDAARVQTGFDFYFNECMTGFEYQAAGHMIAEGMLQEGLAIVRAIHDRYHAARRNPWNEVECGDHYARAMASYGVFLAVCGYEYHGPKGYLAFAPRLTPEDFRAAFTTAEGWGTFAQKRDGGTQKDSIEVKWGKLRLRTLAFTLPEGAKAQKAEVLMAGQAVPSKLAIENGRAVVTLEADAIVTAGQTLEVRLA